eukprot:258038_1
MSTRVLPKQWVPIMLIGFITTVVNGYILKKDYAKRQSKHTKRTKKIWSLLSMISAASFALFHFIHYFPGFCLFSDKLSTTAISLQACFTGFYRLSKLYSCFSKNQLYSSKGYSNIIFVIMYSFGTILLLHALIAPWFVTKINRFCTMNTSAEFIVDNDDNHYIMWTITIFICYLLWDLCILLLYGMKIKSFDVSNWRSGTIHIEVHSKIMYILNKIAILTVFYELWNVLSIVMSIVIVIYSQQTLKAQHLIALQVCWHLGFMLASVTMNIAMFLMEEHNTKEYVQFIRILHKYHLCRICPGFHSVIMYEVKRDLEENLLPLTTSDTENIDNINDEEYSYRPVSI